MAYKVELTRNGVAETLVLDANMVRNEGTKTVLYKDGSVVRMVPTESVDDLYVISDEEAGFPPAPSEPEPQPEVPVEETPVDDEVAPEEV